MFVSGSAHLPEARLEYILKTLATLSESRGKESSGFAFWNPSSQTLEVIKAPVAATELLSHHSFRSALTSLLKRPRKHDVSAYGIAAIGHSRLVTNGSQLDDKNNQPVVRDGIAAVHNGIIVNAAELWRCHAQLQAQAEVDTEVMLALTSEQLKTDAAPSLALSQVFGQLFGTVATAILFADRHEALLATNNGSLYTLNNAGSFVAFASERFILQELSRKAQLRNLIGEHVIAQVKPNTGIRVDLKSLRLDPFNAQSHARTSDQNSTVMPQRFVLTERAVFDDRKSTQRASLVDTSRYGEGSEATHERALLQYHLEAIRRLKRCSVCVLPETFPFIVFDESGVCSYCRNYVRKRASKSLDSLHALVEPYRSKTGEPDCLVPFSGGRDSTYALHVIKRELGLNPVTLTYDWGMVTDLARRNIARACSRLGVENIIVSADIRQKRENIRKNIAAWLEYPQLGMTPLFMAGDKYFFYYTNKVKKQLGIRLNMWGVNPLENTDFKIGYAGIRPQFDKKRIYSLDFPRQLQLFSFVGRNVIRSPRYFNASLFDTFGSFVVRYFYPKQDYYHLFDYHAWDETAIVGTIRREYDWELAPDTSSTWRIGDGTASFYNYIYTTVGGFSENDTFRSNQIREGLLSRDQALKHVEEENRPRYESLKWYLQIVGVPFQSTIMTINAIPKRYRT